MKIKKGRKKLRKVGSTRSSPCNNSQGSVDLNEAWEPLIDGCSFD